MNAETILYFETGSNDPAYNLAFEEFVHRTYRDMPCLLLWQNDRSVIIGQNQNAEREIDRAFTEANDIRVVRRATGGGAVYHDLGNLNYSFIADVKNAEAATYRRFTLPVAEALQALGIDARVSGRNDITVDDKKISGTAQRLLGARLLHHGTLLFDSDLSMLSRALRPDPLKLQSRGTRSVRTRIENIRPMLTEDMDILQFHEYLKARLGGGRLVPMVLSNDETARVMALKKEKYDTWEWNFGRAPAFSVTSRKKWPGGILEAGVNVKEGLITDIRFFGDFLSLEPTEPLSDALRSCPFRREDVDAILRDAPLWRYFGSITADEILTTVFEM